MIRMMKLFSLTLLLTCSCLFALAQEKNDWAKDELKGKVKSVTVYCCKVKKAGGKVIKGRMIQISASILQQ